MNNLAEIAEKMVTPGKGILAADESTGSITKRFESIKLDSTEDNRRDYRHMLFSATDAMKSYISGVILFDETIRQKTRTGSSLVEIPGAGHGAHLTHADEFARFVRTCVAAAG